jgi:hypothetical protein
MKRTMGDLVNHEKKKKKKKKKNCILLIIPFFTRKMKMRFQEQELLQQQ